MLDLGHVAGGLHIDAAPTVRRLAGAPEEGVRALFYMKVGRNWGGMSSSIKEADIQFLVGRLRDFYQSANS